MIWYVIVLNFCWFLNNNIAVENNLVESVTGDEIYNVWWCVVPIRTLH